MLQVFSTVSQQDSPISHRCSDKRAHFQHTKYRSRNMFWM